jgi:hypothetical protein
MGIFAKGMYAIFFNKRQGFLFAELFFKQAKRSYILQSIIENSASY